MRVLVVILKVLDKNGVSVSKIGLYPNIDSRTELKP
jgi:hypothetical protein